METQGENPLLTLWERNQSQRYHVEAKIKRLKQLAEKGEPIPSGRLSALCFQQTRLRARLGKLASAISQSDR